MRPDFLSDQALDRFLTEEVAELDGQDQGTAPYPQTELLALREAVLHRPAWCPTDAKRLDAVKSVAHRARALPPRKAGWGWSTAGTRAALAMAVIGVAIIAGLQYVPSFERSGNAPVVKEYQTRPGQRATITLPDSSTIVLAPQSRVQYNGWSEVSAGRVVELEGQALFAVTHNRNVPFVVRAGGVTTKVLGTSFSVRRYATDTAVQVVVAQGRVAVENTILNTGDVATARQGHQVSVARGQATHPHLAWTQGSLVFFNTPLRDVIPELERWYDIAIEVTDPSLLNRRVITTLDTEGAGDAVEIVAFIVHGRAQFDGHRAVISSR